MATGESLSTYASIVLMLIHMTVGASGFIALVLTVLWSLGSRRSWPLRAIGWLTLLLLFAATGAGEVVVFCIAFSLWLVILVNSAERLAGWCGGAFLPVEWAPRSWGLARFRVVDLFWFTALCGGVFAVIAAIVRQETHVSWARTVLASGAAALAATAVTGCALRRLQPGETKRFLWLAATLAVAAVSAFVWTVADPWDMARGRVLFPTLGYFTVLVALMLYLLVGCRCGWIDRRGQAAMRWHRLPRLFCGTVLILSCTLTINVYWRMVTPPATEVTPSLVDNAYQELGELTVNFRTDNIPQVETATKAELRAFARRLGPLLEKTRVLLRRPFQIPVGYSRESKYARHAQLSRFTLLALAFDVEAELALEDGDPDQAAQYALDCILLGYRAARGGLTSDWYYGRAMERIGIDRFRSCRGRLDAKRCRMLVKRLLTVDSERESFEEAIVRNGLWRQQVDGWRGRYQAIASQLAGIRRWSIPLEVARWNDSLFRLLIVDLAVRAFALEKQSYPEDLRQLVPDLLDRMPTDPCSGRPLVYRRLPDSYLLYGVGLDGRDNGGDLVPLREMYRQRGDLFLDFPEAR